MPRFIIQHITKYTYAEPVRESANQVKLFPIKDEYQLVESQKVNITGEPFLDIYKDYYDNEVGSFMNIAPHTELIIDSTISVVTRERPLPQDVVPAADQWKHLNEIKQLLPFLDFLKQENFKDLAAIKAIADESLAGNPSVYTAVLRLNEYVYRNFQYIKGITSVETTVDEIWKMKAGVCQDFAHILLVMLRLLNIPARYVSGYVCPKDDHLRGEGATHAWVEAYIPFYGWLGIDPTNNCIVNDRHVRLAIGRNFADCSPVKGTYKGTASQTLEVGVTVSTENGTVTNREAINLLTSTPPPSVQNKESNSNSYRRYMEMVQQQQQQ
ncbi:MAG: transglutaminase family protein [Ferruginibacter sp.]